MLVCASQFCVNLELSASDVHDMVTSHTESRVRDAEAVMMPHDTHTRTH